MNKVIRHYGILGQKWGRRRFQNSDGTRTTAGKIREQNKDGEKTPSQTSDDYKQSLSDKSKAPKGLSNAELKRLNERLQLEKTYSELSAAEKKKNESFGKSILKDIAKSTLTESGKKLATGLMNAFVTDKILEKVVEKTNKK